ncbi:hypothetical protein ES703_06976 [subsurface metagenome]
MKMGTVLHETCEQYVARRLSEGWRVAGRYKHLVFLSPPDGSFIRPVDLRNDIETLRPNAAGDYTNISFQYPSSTYHWDKVDDVAPDDDGTYVYNQTIYPAAPVREKDVYGLEGSSIPEGAAINSVTVYFRFGSDMGFEVQCKPLLRLGTDETVGAQRSQGGSIYGTFSQALTRPGGGDWSPSDMADLQVGIDLYPYSVYPNFAKAKCTQVYVEIDYTPPTLAYKDIATRFKLRVQGFADIATRFKLAVQAHQDIGARFKLQVQSHKDTATRFILTVLNYQDIAARFKLTVQAYQDVDTRFKLIVAAFTDITTRFRLLPPPTHEDVSTRFFLYQPSWKSLQILADIAALEAHVAGLKPSRRAHFEI